MAARMGELKQGVTLEVFGEGSMGPMNDRMKQEAKARQSDITFDIGWTTLGQYLDWLVARGISPNIASFVGAATVRVNELGYADRAPTPEELDRMRAHVKTAMEEGAMGVSSALIYAPGVLREDRRADRALRGRVPVRRHVHLAHAQRRRTGWSKPWTN